MSDNVLAARTGVRSEAAVAVIGLAYWLPDATDPETFWDVLCDVAGAFPPLQHGSWHVPRDQQIRDEWLDGPDEFDAALFGLSTAELATLDPHRRLILELSCAALEDAGASPEILRAAEAAVFLGGGRPADLAYRSLCSGAARLALVEAAHLPPALERTIGFASGSTGVAVLKRLTDAVLDGDIVYYVLVGGATGPDGPAPTVPDIETQQALLHAAYSDPRVLYPAGRHALL
ncbi:beta-ketoacyl synthase N-terminal-like domain-containing protein [Nocardia sp. NPDC088792]|uniref:beta-ketoacyl synthase N-terminal-like domain-containing protein n=1 Tax=Nocardia sp. NPDC088792 TaxID=3364332 RepID=UPI0037FB8FA6